MLSLTRVASFLWLIIIKLFNWLTVLWVWTCCTRYVKTNTGHLTSFSCITPLYCSIFLPPDPTRNHIFQRTCLFSWLPLPVFSVAFETNLIQLSFHPYYNVWWVINDLHSRNQTAAFPSLDCSCALTCDIFTACTSKYSTYLKLALPFSVFLLLGSQFLYFFVESFLLLPQLQTLNAPRVVLYVFLPPPPHFSTHSPPFLSVLVLHLLHLFEYSIPMTAQSRPLVSTSLNYIFASVTFHFH